MSTRLLAITLLRERAEVVRCGADLIGRNFDTIIWLTEPEDSLRELAAARLAAHTQRTQLIATRMRPMTGMWDESPLVRPGGTTTHHDDRSRTLVLTHNLQLIQRVDERRLQPRMPMYGEDNLQPSEPTRLSTWLAQRIIHRMPAEDVAEVLGACVAQKLNP